MGRKLFGKDISPSCDYCSVGEKSSDGTVVFCPKKGIVPTDFFCKKFSYDPLRRVPHVAPSLEQFTAEDFEL